MTALVDFRRESHRQRRRHAALILSALLVTLVAAHDTGCTTRAFGSIVRLVFVEARLQLPVSVPLDGLIWDVDGFDFLEDKLDLSVGINCRKKISILIRSRLLAPVRF